LGNGHWWREFETSGGIGCPYAVDEPTNNATATAVETLVFQLRFPAIGTSLN
jgi:hypothetical protein